MKKLIFAAIAIAAFACCTKNEVKEVVNDTPISFKTVVGTPSTKADELVSDTNYPTDETFGTAAFYTAGTADFSATSDLYIPESQVEYNKPTAGFWSTATPYYWPKPGSGHLTFFSYSPYDVLEPYTTIDATNGIIISNYTLADHQKVDVMIADYKTNQTANGTNASYVGVPTVFRHKLAQIVNFTFKTDADYCTTKQAGALEFFINKVSINKIYTVGTYTSGNDVDANAAKYGEWVAETGTKVDYVWYNNADCLTGNQFNTVGTAVIGGVSPCDAQIQANGYLLVLPQSFEGRDDATLSIEYTIRHYTSATGYTDEKAKAEVKLNLLHHTTAPVANAWNMNRKISYTITVGMDNQILWAPSVVVWDTETITDGNGFVIK